MSATPRRAPRLSVPGGLLLALCIFLPAVKGCDKPVYPYEAPLCLGPYLFGLLVAVLALCPPGKKALIAAYSAWTLGSAAALGGAYFFLTGLLSHNKVDHRLVGTVFVCWIPPLLALLLSVRKRGDSERWRAQLLWSGGCLCFLFFLFWTLSEQIYIGMWLSLLASVLLIAEGALAQRSGTPASG